MMIKTRIQKKKTLFQTQTTIKYKFPKMTSLTSITRTIRNVRHVLQE